MLYRCCAALNIVSMLDFISPAAGATIRLLLLLPTLSFRARIVVFARCRLGAHGMVADPTANQCVAVKQKSYSAGSEQAVCHAPASLFSPSRWIPASSQPIIILVLMIGSDFGQLKFEYTLLSNQVNGSCRWIGNRSHMSVKIRVEAKEYALLITLP